MRVVAYAELVILVRVIVGAIIRKNSLLSPLIYAHFLRQRYYHSIFTRNAIAHVSVLITNQAQKFGNPTVIRVWENAQVLIGRWGGSTLAPQQPAAAGAAGATGAGANGAGAAGANGARRTSR